MSCGVGRKKKSSPGIVTWMGRTRCKLEVELQSIIRRLFETWLGRTRYEGGRTWDACDVNCRFGCKE